MLGNWRLRFALERLVVAWLGGTSSGFMFAGVVALGMTLAVTLLLIGPAIS